MIRRWCRRVFRWEERKKSRRSVKHAACRLTHAQSNNATVLIERVFRQIEFPYPLRIEKLRLAFQLSGRLRAHLQVPDWELPLRMPGMSKRLWRSAVQVIASLLVLVPPVVLFSSQVRVSSTQRLATVVLLVGLVAQCLESEAALWLMLKPTLIWAMSPRRGMGTAATVPKESCAIHQLGSVPAIGGSVRGRVDACDPMGAGGRSDAAGYLLLAAFLVVPLALCAAIWRLSVAPTRRAIAAVVLVAMAFPCAVSLGPVFTAGRKSLERSIGTCRIAGECVKLFGECSAADKYGWVTVDSAASPVLTRLKPAYIHVWPGGVKVEFGGGFEHYGYRVSKDESGTQWVLEWYSTEGPWPDETLLTWLIGSEPCERDPPSGP